jgi:hypothetical protein
MRIINKGSVLHRSVSRDSSVGIATDYGLDGSGIESRWGARFSAPLQTGPGAHPACCTMNTGSFPGVRNGRGVTLTPHPLLVSWSRKGRAIPLLPLWAVRPVQSLSACARMHSTFTFYYTGPQSCKPHRSAQCFSTLQHNHLSSDTTTVKSAHLRSTVQGNSKRRKHFKTDVYCWIDRISNFLRVLQVRDAYTPISHCVSSQNFASMSV